jgi:hypothetical protein
LVVKPVDKKATWKKYVQTGGLSNSCNIKTL